jgi:3-oxoacyl-[acyl-carrier-protein] synthase-3
MTFENMYISGTGRRLPDRLTVADAEEQGLCESRHIWRSGFASVCISARESAPEMAAHAARSALRQARCGPEDISLILHADTYYQGHDLWPPALYVQREAVGNRCPAIEVRQMSNGGLAALELAAR